MKPIHTSIRPDQAAEATADHLLGDGLLLVEQIGSMQTLAPVSVVAESLRLNGVNGVPALARFLETYDVCILRGVEFPAILQALHHAVRGEARELIALDKRLEAEPLLAAFARASSEVGGRQLRNLGPLRDHRVTQRYLAAVETGQANGWHPLVYGLTVGIYSLPPRQALLRYAEETLAGLASAAGRSRQLSKAACQKIVDGRTASLPAAIEEALRRFGLPAVLG